MKNSSSRTKKFIEQNVCGVDSLRNNLDKWWVKGGRVCDCSNKATIVSSTQCTHPHRLSPGRQLVRDKGRQVRKGLKIKRREHPHRKKKRVRSEVTCKKQKCRTVKESRDSPDSTKSENHATPHSLLLPLEEDKKNAGEVRSPSQRQ